MDCKKKASGEIHQIGFSYHGNTKDFELVDTYDWDFCMINTIIWTKQSGWSGKVCNMLRQRDFR
ncbi:MAG: hypothetical protein ACLTDV_12915 [Eubacterium sp.]